MFLIVRVCFYEHRVVNQDVSGKVRFISLMAALLNAAIRESTQLAVQSGRDMGRVGGIDVPCQSLFGVWGSSQWEAGLEQ